MRRRKRASPSAEMTNILMFFPEMLQDGEEKPNESEEDVQGKICFSVSWLIPSEFEWE